MNIQDKMQDIHHKYGVSEKANYEIEKFVEKLIEKDRAEQLILHPVIGYAPTKKDYFTAMAMQGLLAGRTEYEDPQSGLQKAIESADFIIEQLK